MSPIRFSSAIFDCDGVLLDSNGIKAEVFDALVADFGPAVAFAFTAYRQRHPGFHRRRLFSYLFRETLQHPAADECVERYVDEFSRRTREALRNCRRVPGAKETLTRLALQGLSCVVVSAAETLDLEFLLSEHGLSPSLKAIRGGDRAKDEHIAELLDSGDIERPLLYFGDSRADLDAAESVQARFVMVSSVSDWADGVSLCRERGHLVIRDFSDPQWSTFAAEHLLDEAIETGNRRENPEPQKHSPIVG